MGIPSTAAAADRMIVPGGRAALARFAGTADDSAAGLAGSLNRILLEGISRQDRWQDVRGRTDLALYIEVASRLWAMAGDRGLHLEGPSGRRALIDLAALGGYSVRETGATTGLDTLPGDEPAARRRILQALGLNLPLAAMRIDAGSTFTFAIVEDDAEPLLPLSEWSKLAGQTVTPENALITLARDQRAGLLAEGCRALDPAMREALGPDATSLLYAHAATFYRIAPALRVEKGRVLVPGGPAAEPAWRELLGAESDAPPAIVARLLVGNRGRAAYLWHALSFAPPATVAALLGLPPAGDGQNVTDRLHALDRAAGSFARWADVDEARADGPGLCELLGALPLSADGKLSLPGGAAAWVMALKDPLAQPGASIERRVASAPPMDAAAFVAFLLERRFKRGAIEISVLPVFLEAVGRFEGRSVLRSAAHVAAIVYMTVRFPAALAALDTLPRADGALVPDYAATLAALDGAGRGPDEYVAIASFEGGIELLRQLARAGHVPDDRIDALFRAWLDTHRAARSPLDAAAGELDWLVRLADALPAAEPDDPGRGPRERALLAAMDTTHDPQVFTFDGLDYWGARARTLREEMAKDLDRQLVPRLDDLLDLRAALAEAGDAARAGNGNAFRAATQRAVTVLAALPDETTTEEDGIAAWIAPVDRAPLLGILRAWSAETDPSRVARAAERLPATMRLVARDLRPFFVAAGFLPALAQAEPLLRRDATLVRRYTVVRHLDSVRRAGDANDTPWHRPYLVPAGEIGKARVAGHIAGVPSVIGAFQYAVPAGLGKGRQHAVDLSREWFDDTIGSRWPQVGKETARWAFELERAGAAVISAARAGSEPARAFVARRIPPARLLTGPSERILLGLALVEGDAYGSSQPELLAAPLPWGDVPHPSLRQLLAPLAPAARSLPVRSVTTYPDWPSYESLVAAGDPALLHDRELVDLHAAIAVYLGRHALPGDVGRDLEARILHDLPEVLDLDSARDWQGFLRWLDRAGDDFFDERMRQCFAMRLYSVR